MAIRVKAVTVTPAAKSLRDGCKQWDVALQEFPIGIIFFHEEHLYWWEPAPCAINYTPWPMEGTPPSFETLEEAIVSIQAVCQNLYGPFAQFYEHVPDNPPAPVVLPKAGGGTIMIKGGGGTGDSRFTKD